MMHAIVTSSLLCVFVFKIYESPQICADYLKIVVTEDEYVNFIFILNEYLIILITTFYIYSFLVIVLHETLFNF